MSSAKRSTLDLISELDAEKAKFFCVALAVGFEKNTTFVWASEMDRLEKLNEAVAAGGEPVGLIGVVQSSADLGHGELAFYTRLLAEHAGKEWAEEYLGVLVEEVATLLKVRSIEKRPDWPN